MPIKVLYRLEKHTVNHLFVRSMILGILADEILTCFPQHGSARGFLREQIKIEDPLAGHRLRVLLYWNHYLPKDAFLAPQRG